MTTCAHDCNEPGHPDDDGPDHTGCGDKGDKGERGVNGTFGLPGGRGLTGPVGQTVNGAAGPKGVPSSLFGVRGPSGVMGETSTEPGSTGEMGLAGAAGSKGTPGTNAVKGEKGPQGEKGPLGANGVAGVATAVNQADIDKINVLYNLAQETSKFGKVVAMQEFLTDVNFQTFANTKLQTIQQKKRIEIETSSLNEFLNNTLNGGGIQALINSEMSRAMVVENSLSGYEIVRSEMVSTYISQVPGKELSLSIELSKLIVQGNSNREVPASSQSDRVFNALIVDNGLEKTIKDAREKYDRNFLDLNSMQISESTRRLSSDAAVASYTLRFLKEERSSVESSLSVMLSDTVQSISIAESSLDLDQKILKEKRRAVMMETDLSLRIERERGMASFNTGTYTYESKKLVCADKTTIGTPSKESDVTFAYYDAEGDLRSQGDCLKNSDDTPILWTKDIAVLMAFEVQPIKESPCMSFGSSSNIKPNVYDCSVYDPRLFLDTTTTSPALHLDTQLKYKYICAICPAIQPVLINHLCYESVAMSSPGEKPLPSSASNNGCSLANNNCDMKIESYVYLDSNNNEDVVPIVVGDCSKDYYTQLPELWYEPVWFSTVLMKNPTTAPCGNTIGMTKTALAGDVGVLSTIYTPTLPTVVVYSSSDFECDFSCYIPILESAMSIFTCDNSSMPRVFINTTNGLPLTTTKSVLVKEFHLDLQLSNLIATTSSNGKSLSDILQTEISREVIRFAELSSSLSSEKDRGLASESTLSVKIAHEASLRKDSYVNLASLIGSDIMKTQDRELDIGKTITYAYSAATSDLAKSDESLKTDKGEFGKNKAGSQELFDSLKDDTVVEENSLSARIVEAKSTAVIDEKSTRDFFNGYVDSSLSNHDAQNNAIVEEASFARNEEAMLKASLVSEESSALFKESDINSQVTMDSSRASMAVQLLDTDLKFEISRAMSSESTIETTGSEQTKQAKAKEAALLSEIQSESTRQISQTQSIDGDMTAENNRGSAADSTLNDMIKAEITEATASRLSISNEISDALMSATAELSETRAKLETEINREKGEGFDLMNEISAVIKSSRSGETVISQLSAGFHTQHVERESTLSNNLDSVHAIASKAELTLTQDLSTAITRSESYFHTANTEDIPAIVLRAKNSEATLDTGISHQIQADNKLFADLSTSVTLETLTAGMEEDNVKNNIKTEKDRASGADSSQTSIYESFSKAAVQSEENILVRISTQVSAAKGTENGITENIQQRSSNATSIESGIEKSLLDEESRARLVEISLSEILPSMVTKHMLEEETLSNLVKEETNRATKEEGILDGIITAENFRATGRETAASSALSGVEKAINFREDDLKSALSTGIAYAITAEQELNKGISAENTAASQAENDLRTKFDASSAARVSEELNLQEELNELSKAAETKHNSVATGSRDEISRARAAESDLTQKNEDEKTSAMTSESSIKLSFADEMTRATSVEDRLSVLLDTSVIKNGPPLAESNADAIRSDSVFFSSMQKASKESIESHMALASSSESTLNAQVTSETSRRSTWDTSMAASIETASKSTKERFENYLTLLKTEKNREETSINLIQENTQNEESRAIKIETSLDNQLSTATQSAFTEEAKIKSSVNDENLRAVASQSALQSDLKTEEKTRAADRNSKLNTDVTAISEVATSAEQLLRDRLNSEILRAKGTEKYRSDSVKGEEDRSKNIRQKLSQQLSEEISITQSGAASIKGALDAQILSARNRESVLSKTYKDELDKSNTYTLDQRQDLTAEANLAKSMESTLQAKLDTEKNFAVSIEASLKVNINSDISSAKSAELGLAQAIASRSTAATTNEDTLAKNLDNEILRANNKEQDLSTSVANRVSNQNGIEASDSTIVKNEQTRTSIAEQAIDDQLNSEMTQSIEQFNTIKKNTELEVSKAVGIEDSITTVMTSEEGKSQTLRDTVSTNLASELVRASIAEMTLAGKEQTEFVRAVDLEKSLAISLQTEKSMAVFSEESLSTAIILRTITASTAEQTTFNALQTEISRAKSEETDINLMLEMAISRAKSNQASILTFISDETAAATGNELPEEVALKGANEKAENREKILTQLIAVESNRARLEEEASRTTLSEISDRATKKEYELSSALATILIQDEPPLRQSLSTLTANTLSREYIVDVFLSSLTPLVQGFEKRFSDVHVIEQERVTFDEKALLSDFAFAVELELQLWNTWKEQNDLISTDLDDSQFYVDVYKFTQQTPVTTLSAKIQAEVLRTVAYANSMKSLISTESTRAGKAEAAIIKIRTSAAVKVQESTANMNILIADSTAVAKEAILSARIATEESRSSIKFAALKVIIDNESDRQSIASDVLMSDFSSRNSILKSEEGFLSSQISNAHIQILNANGLLFNATTLSSNYIKNTIDYSTQLSSEISRENSHNIFTSTARSILLVAHSTAEKNVDDMISSEKSRSILSTKSLADVMSLQYSAALITEAKISLDLFNRRLVEMSTEDSIASEIRIQSLKAGVSETSIFNNLIDSRTTNAIVGAGRLAGIEAFEPSITSALQASNIAAVNFEKMNTNAFLNKELLILVESSLANGIATEIYRATISEESLSIKLSNMDFIRLEVERSLSNSVENAVSATAAVEFSLSEKLSNLVSSDVSSEQILSARVSSGVNRATTEDSMLSDRFDALLGATSSREAFLSMTASTVIGTNKALEGETDSLLSSTSTRGINSFNDLLNLVASHSALANDVVESNQLQSLNNEINSASSAEGTLNTKFENHVFSIKSIENSLSTALSQEISVTISSSVASSTAIAHESASNIATEQSISTAIMSENSRAELSELGISSSISTNLENGNKFHSDHNMQYFSEKGSIARQTVSNYLHTEKEKATLREIVTKNSISSATSAASSMESSFSDAIINEITRVDGVFLSVQAIIDSESNRKNAFTAAFDSNIMSDITKKDINLNIVQGSLDAETSNSIVQEDVLLVAINNEISRFQQSSNSYSDAFTKNAADVIKREFLIDSAIESFSTANVIIEASLSTFLTQEQSRSLSNENEISGSISTLSLRAQRLESSISTQITNEKDNATSMETTVQDVIKTFSSTQKESFDTLSNQTMALTSSSLHVEADLSIDLANIISQSKNAESVLDRSLFAEESRNTLSKLKLDKDLSTASNSANDVLKQIGKEISTLISNRTIVQGGINGDLQIEKSRAESAESLLSAGIESLILQSKNNETGAKQLLALEVSRATTTGIFLSVALKSESSNANDFEIQLKNSLSTVQASIQQKLNLNTADTNDETIRATDAESNARFLVAQQMQNTIFVEQSIYNVFSSSVIDRSGMRSTLSSMQVTSSTTNSNINISLITITSQAAIHEAKLHNDVVESIASVKKFTEEFTWNLSSVQNSSKNGETRIEILLETEKTIAASSVKQLNSSLIDFKHQIDRLASLFKEEAPSLLEAYETHPINITLSMLSTAVRKKVEGVELLVDSLQSNRTARELAIFISKSLTEAALDVNISSIANFTAEKEAELGLLPDTESQRISDDITSMKNAAMNVEHNITSFLVLEQSKAIEAMSTEISRARLREGLFSELMQFNNSQLSDILLSLNITAFNSEMMLKIQLLNSSTSSTPIIEQFYHAEVDELGSAVLTAIDKSQQNLRRDINSKSCVGLGCSSTTTDLCTSQLSDHNLGTKVVKFMGNPLSFRPSNLSIEDCNRVYSVTRYDFSNIVGNGSCVRVTAHFGDLQENCSSSNLIVGAVLSSASDSFRKGNLAAIKFSFSLQDSYVPPPSVLGASTSGSSDSNKKNPALLGISFCFHFVWLIWWLVKSYRSSKILSNVDKDKALLLQAQTEDRKLKDWEARRNVQIAKENVLKLEVERLRAQQRAFDHRQQMLLELQANADKGIRQAMIRKKTAQDSRKNKGQYIDYEEIDCTVWEVDGLDGAEDPWEEPIAITDDGYLDVDYTRNVLSANAGNANKGKSVPILPYQLEAKQASLMVVLEVPVFCPRQGVIYYDDCLVFMKK